MTTSSGRFADADEGDVGVVLGDDEALVVGAGRDLDEDAAAGGRGKGWWSRAIWMVGNSVVPSMPVLTSGETRT